MNHPVRRPFRWVSGAALVALLAACTSTEAPPAPSAPEVAVVTLATQSLDLTRQLPGRVQPFLVAEVRPQVTGIVAERYFSEGGEVEAGAPLYQLDDASYRAEVNSARAALTRAQATAQSARQTAQRSATLSKQGLVSKQTNDDAVAAQREAEAGVGVARAALDSANIVLGYARITAPISGRIGKSSVTQGALVTANQTAALATVQQLDPVYVDLTQSSAELLQLRRDLAAGKVTESDEVAVTILLEDGTPYSQPGRLAFSEVSVNPDTGSYLLRVVVPNPDSLLLPGMYVRAVMSDAQRSDGLLVPQEGVARNPRGDATVLVVAADGKIEQRAIEVSRTEGANWVVESGLAAGDRVVVEGLQKARPGMVVTAVERSAAAAAPESAPHAAALH
ncbi:MAG: efflux RND transporter periplasmic adaptor subunit [Chiayiivirga sp.]|jgi:membrane fusion protein (multidrug efflux system)|uniref:efflux RND transporter periplasmic adaptor subunit n=1 Tax=Chiayiivirga sp. TaxID=2041042 RepID=UPI0025B8D215|nr:efflux RND transporter periplasmic adaptor subunit [Chiayiivirga sp.]MCI1711609.1 efflux RND transporter periplasmic adaptor subunit [Chiayiivirga sp.]MCI1730633.1 efflux RND transporter periplasmic adaptor subunit [Chiayiivirga sp.]